MCRVRQCHRFDRAGSPAAPGGNAVDRSAPSTRRVVRVRRTDGTAQCEQVPARGRIPCAGARGATRGYRGTTRAVPEGMTVLLLVVLAWWLFVPPPRRGSAWPVSGEAAR